MDKMREKHIAEMERLKNAIDKTESEYLKRDYKKALKRMSAELKEYDRYRSEVMQNGKAKRQSKDS
jgi:hypothetical protein